MCFNLDELICDYRVHNLEYNFLPYVRCEELSWFYGFEETLEYIQPVTL